MPAACKLAPAAGLFGILLDGSALASIHGECHGPEALPAGTADGQARAVYFVSDTWSTGVTPRV
jgi:hypothetical protein